MQLWYNMYNKENLKIELLEEKDIEVLTPIMEKEM